MAIMVSINNLDSSSFTIGRNGEYDISAILITSWQPLLEKAEQVFTEMISRKRRVSLKAGFQISAEDMDRLATQWLEARGKLPAK